MRQFWNVTVANFKLTYRDRVALFWMFLFPIMLMLILGSIFGRAGEANIDLGVVDKDRTRVSKAVVGALENIEAFTVSGKSEKSEVDDLEKARKDAVLVIEQGFGRDLQEGRPGEVTLFIDRSNMTVSQITSSTISQVIGSIANGLSGRPELIHITQESVTSSELEYIDFLIPGLLAMTIMFAALMGLSQDIAVWREKGILRRIKVSPIPLSRFLGGGIFNVLVFALIQAFLLLLIGKLVFKVTVSGNYLYTAVIIVLGSVSFLALGFLITSLARTRNSAQTASTAVAMPMMFLSGIFFPPVILPTALLVIAKTLPLYYLSRALTEVMVKGKSLGSVWIDILVLAGMGIVCFAASVKLFRWE